MLTHWLQLAVWVSHSTSKGPGQLLLKLTDMHPSLCLQVGCAMNCQFCYTGRMGLSGNLSTAQIVEQVGTLPGMRLFCCATLCDRRECCLHAQAGRLLMSSLAPALHHWAET